MLGTLALTWLVWHQTWFGVRLSDAELIAAMAPDATARDAQHGIEEISHRLEEGGPGIERWARLLVEASQRPEEPVRVSAAWAMQYDAGRGEFVERLREMAAADASLLVRRNAAGSLAKSGDAAARPVLRSMLEPYTLTAPAAGVVSGLLALDHPARETAVAARIATGADAEVEARLPVPGRIVRHAVAEGARVEAGDALLVLAPDPRHALNAAAGLAIVGTADDVELLALATAPQTGFPPDVQAAAKRAIDAIRARGR